MIFRPGEDPGPADVWPGFAIRRAVESHAVLPLDGGHAVQPGQAGLAEDGEGDGLLQPALLLGVGLAPVLPLV